MRYKIPERLDIVFLSLVFSMLFAVSPGAQQLDPPQNLEAEKNSSDHQARSTIRSQLADILKDGVPKNAVKRAQVRENLYALLATSDDKKSSEQIQQALSRLYMVSGSPTVDLLMKRSTGAIKQKKYDQAVQFLDVVIKLSPDYAEGWNQRAFALYKQDNLSEAAGNLRRALALDANHFRALEGLGTILREVGDEAGAYKVFKRLLEVDPQSDDAQKAAQDLQRKVEGRGI